MWKGGYNTSESLATKARHFFHSMSIIQTIYGLYKSIIKCYRKISGLFKLNHPKNTCLLEKDPFIARTAHEGVSPFSTGNFFKRGKITASMLQFISWPYWHHPTLESPHTLPTAAGMATCYYVYPTPISKSSNAWFHSLCRLWLSHLYG